MTPSSIWAALSLLALAAPVSSFFTINNPTLYKDFDKVDLLINKVQSPNTQLPYSYYELPFTCPTTSDISSIPLSLGQVLRGDRISKSDYQLSFKNDTECAKTCLRLVTAQGIKKAQDLIRQGYSNEWLVDDLPGSTTMINSDDNSKFYMSGFPLGFIRNGRYFLNNHVMMVIRYHKETASNDYSIVGFEVYPRSVADDHCPGAANNYQNYELSESKIKPDLKGAVVPYTYSIYWREETQVSYNQRWDLYINKEETDSIHYLSLFYSLGFAVLFSVFVSMIFTKVKSDTPTNNIAKQSNTYNSNGWRKLKNDVFSTPPYALLLSILGGAGIQLLSTVFLVVVLFAFKILNQNVPGRNLNIAVFLFISAGTISGYFAVYLYDQLTLNDPERFKKRYKAHVGSGATSYHDSIDPPPGARKFKLNNNNNGNSNNNNNNNSNNNNSIKQRSSSITAPASAASASFFSTSNSSSSSSSSSSSHPATSASFASPSSPIVKPHMKRDWFHISFFAGSALPGFLIITLLFLNFFIWAKQSSTALPFGTIVLLIVLYFFLEIPLALIGGFVSYKHALKRQEKSLILPVPVTSPISSPVLDNFDSFANDLNNSAAITNSQQQSQQPHYNKSPLGNNTNSGIQEPGYSKPSRHPIPQQPWHLRTIPNMFLFGIAPFISSYIELFYIYKVIWLEKYSFYCLYGFLFLTLLLLAVLVVESVIISLYWSLNSSGDYHWQWRSFLVGGSASIYVFLYSVLYYMVHLRAQYDFVSGMLYFVYCFLIYLLVVLMFGSVGLVAGHWFTKKIYSSVKRD